jgi:hypothetical protein
MSDLGAYYQWNENQMIGLGPDGVGSTPDSGHGFAEETAQQILREHAIQPIGTYSPWAKLTGDVDWRDLGAPDSDLLLYPVSHALVEQVRAGAFGHPIAWVGVLTKSPLSAARAEATFNGAPYGYTEAYAVYSQDDPGQIPQAYYLYWAQVRDVMDKGGGGKSLDAVAKAMGGKLVFPLNVPRSRRARPHPTAVPFRHAFDAQTMPGGPGSPAAGTEGGTGVQAAATAMVKPAWWQGVPWWGWLLGAGAAYSGYRLVRKPKPKKKGRG